MPLEIRELNIVTTIGEDAWNGSNAGSQSNVDMDKIIAECVEQVLEILKQKQER